MTSPDQKIDKRTALNVADDVQRLIQTYAWKEFDPAPRKPAGVSAALIGVFARFAEIIIERLNQTPQKNFLAFLDLLGNSPLPPQPARVPLTFSLAAGSAVDGVVPPGTQVAAPPAEGEKDPVIFETERELTVTAARLDSIFVRDPQKDRYANLSDLAVAAAPDGKLLFEGDKPAEHFNPIEHIAYFGEEEMLGLPSLKEVDLTIQFSAKLEDAIKIEWGGWNNEEKNNVKSELVAGNISHVVKLGDIPPIPLSNIFGQKRRWLRGRLLTPITLSEVKQSDRVRAKQLPVIAEARLDGTISDMVVAEHSFANGLPVDTSKDFFPFGEKPKLGDVWLISQSVAFSQYGAEIKIEITLAKKVQVFEELTLKWEFWDGRAWSELTATRSEPKEKEIQDGTENLTKSGAVVFRLPKPSLRLPGVSAGKEINGVVGIWLRARISKGNYGKEAEYKLETPGKPADGYVLELATFAPPIISLLKISYTGPKSALLVLLPYNNFAFTPGSNKPFYAADDPVVGGDARPTIYFGFTLPAERERFSQRAVSLFISLKEVVYGQVPDGTDGGELLRLAWEYRGKDGWAKLVVRDGTSGLTRSGVIEFLPPADFASGDEFELNRYWLRVRWEAGKYQFIPRGRRFLLNTTMAAQTVTLGSDTLGSSDGGANQKFRATRTPILDGQRLEVREPELPSAEDQKIINEEGAGAIRIVPAASGRPPEIWVRWREVPDFYASSQRDRHYVLDHQTGEIRFGDGRHGLIPPVGAGNLRLVRSQTGGGQAGNKPSGTIIQLKTTVPYVDKVTNHEAAAGGADAEMLESLLERAPRKIRHHDRAVTIEDFEDLAKLASPGVARAKCIPLRNLIEDPLDKNVTKDPLTGLMGKRGQISVIIVPRSIDPQPLPRRATVQRVQAYLEAYSTPTANISVVGPLYIPVSVTLQVALSSLEGASIVEQAVLRSLDDFLHPLTGGLDGTGWDFGREPHDSDLYALIEAVPGVDHIRSLKIKPPSGDESEIKKTGRFLVFSGAHRISLTFVED